MALNITTEARRCLQCKKPLCKQGCPAGTPIPEVIGLFRENRLMDAGKLLFENNPMSLVCSMVTQLEMERWEAAQTNRSVCPTIQLVMNPP